MSSATVAAHTPFTLLPFDSKLDRLAEVAVRIGAGLQPEQEFVITAPLDAAPLVRRITEQAYKAGAKLVTTFYADDVTTLARYQHAPDASFDYAPTWYYDALAHAYESNAARMGITGADPALLASQDPNKVSRANMAMSKAYKPAMELITRHAINWTIVAAATPAWAELVFPNDPPEVALSNLWEAIFFTSRITGDDPIADWKQHNANLLQRVRFLNDKRYHSIRFFTPDNATDLTVGLADQHLWAGGGTTAGNGFYCNANIPTEECFTTPHKSRVNGHVAASKPLSHQGTLIENIRCTFQDGKHRQGHCLRRRSRHQQAHLHRRRRTPARRSRPRPPQLPHRAIRHPLLEHPLRRERRLPHRPRPGLLHLPHRRRQNVQRTTSRPRRQ